MTTANDTLRLAVPKGRILEELLPVLSRQSLIQHGSVRHHELLVAAHLEQNLVLSKRALVEELLEGLVVAWVRRGRAPWPHQIV